VYFTSIWYILWPFDIWYGVLIYSFPFWYVHDCLYLAALDEVVLDAVEADSMMRIVRAADHPLAVDEGRHLERKS
jgi:hypothetical protein